MTVVGLRSFFVAPATDHLTLGINVSGGFRQDQTFYTHCFQVRSHLLQQGSLLWVVWVYSPLKVSLLSIKS